ncbi:alpha/beta hydrolase [Nonlabens spongiae]|uniref:alpha/beta hydrolase n=1 Tax=Nonlabens spongiae TaxID=331648 RepID=UPI001B808D2E|nr:alpha/beta hydrolase-fold protein [Nonlabens spongiae]
MLDGSIDENFIHRAGIVQFGSFSWIQMVPETIVVGISNIDRKRDFTYPSKNGLDQTEFPTSGGSSYFIKFLETELQPFVARNFRTTSTSTLIGQSLGGLLATEILFAKPDLFTNYIIVSPSLWWDNEELLNKEPITSIKEKSIYIAVGKEGAVMERLAKELFEKIQNNKEVKTRIYYNFLEDKDHGDALHIPLIKLWNKFLRVRNKCSYFIPIEI